MFGAVGLLLAQLTTLQAAAAAAATTTEEARPFPRRLHETVALRIADVLRSHTRATAIEAALALLQSLALVASSPHVPPPPPLQLWPRAGGCDSGAQRAGAAGCAAPPP